MPPKQSRKQEDITKTPPRPSAGSGTSGVTPGTKSGARAQGKNKKNKSTSTSAKEKLERQSTAFMNFFNTAKVKTPMAKDKGAKGSTKDDKVEEEARHSKKTDGGEEESINSPTEEADEYEEGGFNPSGEGFDVDMTTPASKMKPKWIFSGT